MLICICEFVFVYLCLCILYLCILYLCILYLCICRVIIELLFTDALLESASHAVGLPTFIAPRSFSNSSKFQIFQSHLICFSFLTLFYTCSGGTNIIQYIGSTQQTWILVTLMLFCPLKTQSHCLNGPGLPFWQPALHTRASSDEAKNHIKYK